MTDDVEFECTACHKDCTIHHGETMTACRLCGRLHCSDCVDEFGNCVECAEKQPPPPS
jgi:hypothetical protein